MTLSAATAIDVLIQTLATFLFAALIFDEAIIYRGRSNNPLNYCTTGLNGL